MPMTLITATPGSGKTLYAISMIYRFLNEGRDVYTNILGINIDGVRTFDLNVPHVHDWRDLPNGSVVIYDECHEHPAFSDKNLIEDRKLSMKHKMDIGDSLSMHRHFGFEFVFITQDPRQIDSRLYQFFDRHLHLIRPYGMKHATIYEWFDVKTAPNTATARNDSKHTRKFVYPKHLFSKYKSSEQNTIKAKFPKKYTALLVLLALFLLHTAYDAYQRYTHTGIKKSHTEQTTNPLDQPTQPQPIPPAPPDPVKIERYRVAATFASGDKCKAFNSAGERLNFITDDECLAYSNHEVRFKAADPSLVQSRLDSVNYGSSGSDIIEGKYIN